MARNRNTDQDAIEADAERAEAREAETEAPTHPETGEEISQAENVEAQGAAFASNEGEINEESGLSEQTETQLRATPQRVTVTGDDGVTRILVPTFEPHEAPTVEPDPAEEERINAIRERLYGSADPEGDAAALAANG